MENRYAKKKIVVVGAGKSGRALCRFFASRSAHVWLSDQRREDEIEEMETLVNLPVRFDFDGHDAELFKSADLVVLSPGVPDTIVPVIAARGAGVEIVGEIEIAVRELAAPMIGITGTNGKSTVTSLAGQIFKAAGLSTYTGGNIGEPLTDAVAGGPWDWIVIELSSFQLETMYSFRPRYSMLLNISSDHLDRYADMDAYVAAKKRIFMNQTAADYAVLNADDEQVMQVAAACPAQPILFSCSRELPEGMSLDKDRIVWRWQGRKETFPLAELQLRGLHNVANAMAAMIPALVEGVDAETAWRAVRGFSGLPHRMKLVRVLDGVAWYNDSKGTNIGSVVMSLAGLKAPVTLIAGGKDKGGDFGVLTEPIRQKVENLILIGQAAERIAREIGNVTRIHRAVSLEEAVQKAREVTATGGTVLLSPGCSSFDMFRNFADRGEQFTRLVDELETEKAVSNGNTSGI